MTAPRSPLLVVAGEPSGDRALGAVVRALPAGAFSSIFGIGGDALAAAGVDLVAHVRDVSGLGVTELVPRARAIASALARSMAAIMERRPRTALLVSWSFANARLGRLLRARGVRVVWVAPPEIWAWGGWRARGLARSADLFACTLPFEATLWRAAGAHAIDVGHPAADVALSDRASLRTRLGIADSARAVVILPGSRPAEIAALAPSFCEAARRIFEHDRATVARVVVAPSIDAASRGVLEDLARRHDIGLLEAPSDAGALALLPAFDAALVASGTASLECAIAGVPPVVAYVAHPVTLTIARRLLDIDRIALPNILAKHAGGAAPFIERVGVRLDAALLARDLEATLRDCSALVAACAQVKAQLSSGFVARVASIVVASPSPLKA